VKNKSVEMDRSKDSDFLVKTNCVDRNNPTLVIRVRKHHRRRREHDHEERRDDEAITTRLKPARASSPPPPPHLSPPIQLFASARENCKRSIAAKDGIKTVNSPHKKWQDGIFRGSKSKCKSKSKGPFRHLKAFFASFARAKKKLYEHRSCLTQETHIEKTTRDVNVSEKIKFYDQANKANGNMRSSPISRESVTKEQNWRSEQLIEPRKETKSSKKECHPTYIPRPPPPPPPPPPPSLGPSSIRVKPSNNVYPNLERKQKYKPKYIPSLSNPSNSSTNRSPNSDGKPPKAKVITGTFKQNELTLHSPVSQSFDLSNQVSKRSTADGTKAIDRMQHINHCTGKKMASSISTTLDGTKTVSKGETRASPKSPMLDGTKVQYIQDRDQQLSKIKEKDPVPKLKYDMKKFHCSSRPIGKMGDVKNAKNTVEKKPLSKSSLSSSVLSEINQADFKLKKNGHSKKTGHQISNQLSSSILPNKRRSSSFLKLLHSGAKGLKKNKNSSQDFSAAKGGSTFLDQIKIGSFKLKTVCKPPKEKSIPVVNRNKDFGREFNGLSNILARRQLIDNERRESRDSGGSWD